jgi:hypothetical protein
MVPTGGDSISSREFTTIVGAVEAPGTDTVEEPPEQAALHTSSIRHNKPCGSMDRGTRTFLPHRAGHDR